MWRTTCALAAALCAAGCKNQNTGQINNPFMAADRVPPPSTRVLAPGTAQPYYPGDQLPGAGPLGAPVIGTPVPAAGYPASGGPGSAALPGALPGGAGPAATPPLTTPPGGWGGATYAPQSSLDPLDAVRVPDDGQALRFAQSAGVPPTSLVADASALGAGIAGMQAPGQAALPLGNQFPGLQNSLAMGGAGQAASRLAGAREVTPAEYLSTGSSPPSSFPALASPDGFRPQGAVRQASLEQRPAGAFQPPSITREGVARGGEGAQFAAGENFASLRGQLEYWPTTGGWSLRYLEEGAPADSLGGRVMIENPQVLANLQPGEMVSVRGQLFGKPSAEGTMTPTYRVSGVERQRY
ncbi:MAG TPA: hypothetical protein VEQ85_01140 [Lacipirellulaceae bacterium]|nr:hypothetical protein [Lacipirellulaceae bacterium]